MGWESLDFVDVVWDMVVELWSRTISWTPVFDGSPVAGSISTMWAPAGMENALAEGGYNARAWVMKSPNIGAAALPPNSSLPRGSGRS